MILGWACVARCCAWALLIVIVIIIIIIIIRINHHYHVRSRDGSAICLPHGIDVSDVLSLTFYTQAPWPCVQTLLHILLHGLHRCGQRSARHSVHSLNHCRPRNPLIWHGITVNTREHKQARL